MEAARAFVERKSSFGIVSRIWGGGGAVDLQLWALAVARRVERSCARPVVSACTVCLVVGCLCATA